MSGGASFKPDFAVVVGRQEPGSLAVIEVRGELDSGGCEELLQAVQDAVAEGGRELILDLRPMTFIDSAGTRSLIMIERLTADRGVALTVMAPPDHVTELLRTAGLAERMDLDSPAAAASASGFIERTELELPRDPHSPARARVEVREFLEGWDQTEGANVVLLTSELVTNAVVHPRGVGNSPVLLRLTRYESHVRVDVEDSGDGFQHVQSARPEDERGRGLFLVDRFSDRWGREHVQTDDGARFRVWFEAAWPSEGATAASG